MYKGHNTKHDISHVYFSLSMREILGVYDFLKRSSNAYKLFSDHAINVVTRDMKNDSTGQ